MKRVLPTLLLCLLVAGCATAPFDEAPRADFRQVEPSTVLAEFDAAVGYDFECLESVVFRFFGKELTGLGYVAINADDGSYALVCMNPAGIKLFEFRGVGADVETLFMPPQLEKIQERFAESVAQDIRRIYFGWVPPADAALKRKNDRLIYTSRTDDGKVEYTYAGIQRALVRKRFSKGWRTQCTIDYFEYKNVGEKLYPHGIVLHNRQYHYSLVLRVKSVLSSAEAGSVKRLNVDEK